MNREYDVANAAPPEDVLQQHLVRLWQELFDKRPLGIDDDFFEIGGNPQMCDRLFAACGEFLDEPLRLEDVGARLSIRNLASLLVAHLEARASGGARAMLRPPSGFTGPQNILQDRLTELWEQVLGRTRVGIDDDFFALGGTPESAKRMFAAVEERYGERIGEGDLATSRLTVRQLADALVARVLPAPVVRIQAGAPAVAPLFFCHGDIGGAGYYMREFARALGPERPVSAFHLHGLHGDDVPSSIEAIAADNSAVLTRLWTDGPVYLGGFCLGGIIAFEMARQLTAQGRQIACTLLIDPPLVRPAGRLRWLPPPRLSPEARRMPGVRVAWLLSHYLSILRDYTGGPYFGKVAVFWPTGGRRQGDGADVQAMVQALAPNVEFYACPGTHATTLGRDLNGTAAAIRACLQVQTV